MATSDPKTTLGRAQTSKVGKRVRWTDETAQIYGGTFTFEDAIAATGLDMEILPLMRNLGLVDEDADRCDAIRGRLMAIAGRIETSLVTGRLPCGTKLEKVDGIDAGLRRTRDLLHTVATRMQDV